MKKNTVIIIEDDADDVDLIKIELGKLDVPLEYEVAETQAELRELLESVLPDIVISDFNLPGFTGLEALEIVREFDPDLPFVLCSGFIGEEKAVDAMRKGVNDYALKNNLSRLGRAVLRELEHYEVRKKKRIDEQLVEATFNASGLSVAIVDEDGNFTKVNERFAELSGYSMEELIGLSYARLNEEDKIEEAETVLKRILSEGGSHTNEWKLIRKDGSVRYVQSTVSRLKNSGLGNHIISYVQDITERKRLKAIREQTEIVTDVGGWEMDLVLDRVYCNGKVLEIFKLPDGLELTIDDFLEKLEPESQKIFKDALEKTITDGQSFDLIIRTVENGEKKWIRVTGVPQKVDGRTIRIHGTFRDITEQESKKEEIRKLSLVASKTHNGVIIFDSEEKIEWVNESFLKATGYTFEDFSGTRVGDLLAGEDTDPETIKRARLKFKQRTPFKEEILIYTQDNREKWFELDVTPVYDESSNEHKYVGIQEDITERKQLEKERKVALDNLTKRVKEQSCLYNISSLEVSSVEELLEGAVQYVPGGLQYPEVAAVAVGFDDTTFQSEGYRDTDWKLSVERHCLNERVLGIAVVYLKEMPTADVGPFLEEERQLIDTIADQLRLKIDRLLGELELLEKERRLEKMGEISRIGYWELDLESDIVFMSSMTKQIFEVDDDYLPELETAYKFYKEGEDRATIKKAVEEAIQQGASYDVELRIVTAKGKEIWTRSIGEPVMNEKGECIRLSGSFQDIDKRKQAQIESERNRLLLETISRQAEAPIWVHDSENRYLFVNQQWKRTFGMIDEKIIGKTIFEVFEEPMAADFQEKDRKVLDTNRSLIFEERVLTPDGERYYLTTRFPMSGIPGVGRGVGGVATDITERKQMEDELKFHSHLLDEIGEAVITTDPDGKIIYWNSAAEELYGWKESEAIGQNVMEITPSVAGKEMAAEIFAKLKEGENWSGEFDVRRKDDTEFPASVTNSPVFNEEGDLIAIIGISSDITERKANEERIMRSLKEKEFLLGEVHHRVKNNLAIISSLISLQMENLEDESLRYVLENSRNRIHSIAMVHELLYQAENFSEIPFEKYIQNLLQAIKKTIGFNKKRVKILTDVAVDDLNINQAIPLGLMLNEVITNSLKYAFAGREEGTIQVRITRSDNQITVLYEDDGNGYPEEIDFSDTESLGHILIHTLLKQLDADYRVDTSGRFKLEFQFEDRESGSHSNL